VLEKRRVSIVAAGRPECRRFVGDSTKLKVSFDIGSVRIGRRLWPPATFEDADERAVVTVVRNRPTAATSRVLDGVRSPP
jgi:hypothetical protein